MTIAGIGFGTDKVIPPTVNWGAHPITALYSKVAPIVLTDWISKFSDKSMTVSPPPGDAGSVVVV